MLQVRIAELNRTALREVGADILAVDPSSGNIVGTQIGGAIITALGTGSTGTATGEIGNSSTAFGLFPSGDWQVLLNILRSNSVLSILAEPNLVALNGHKASFLAGGQFPIPVPQGGGGNNTVTIEFKDFGVHLDFVPYIQDDGIIRLQVDSEVSTIDFSIGTTLVVGGDPVPGLNTRKANTTVEIRQGQTLAIAGLLNVELDAQTERIPGLGDLPYIGPFFSNTSHERVEKELIVLVTPLLVAPMDSCEVGPLPGSEIKDPNDKEFYLLNRIEGRTGRHHRSTTSWDNPLGLVECLELQNRCTCGPVGFSE
jgi:pilus assembly protein CpaC